MLRIQLVTLSRRRAKWLPRGPEVTPFELKWLTFEGWTHGRSIDWSGNVILAKVEEGRYIWIQADSSSFHMHLGQLRVPEGHPQAGELLPFISLG